MTEAEYYAAVRAMGLRPSNVPDTYLDRENDSRNVPAGSRQTAEQRIATIKRLRLIVLGSSEL